MTRTRKAIVTSGFGYLQFASAIVLGLIVTPLVLRQVDPRAFGLWLAAFTRELAKRPLVPVNDPGLPVAMEVHAHG